MSEGAERWLVFANEDLRMAELALEDGIYNQTCFHSQQCVEKSLKGALAHHQSAAPPRTHSIADLLRLLPEEWFKDIRASLLETMDDYYLPTRYPDALPGTLPEGLPGKTEADEAIVLARQTLAAAKQLTGQA